MTSDETLANAVYTLERLVRVPTNHELYIAISLGDHEIRVGGRFVTFVR